MRQTFLQQTEMIMKAIKPLYEVLQAMYNERYLQMGFLYYMIERAKSQIRKADSKHAQKYTRFIERRWNFQMDKDLNLAGKQELDF